MRRCTDCQHCDPRGIKYYCPIKDYFVSIQAIWCKYFELDIRYELWKFFSDEHGLTLTEGQLTDIIREVEKYQKTLNEKK
jgi:hypothetical protein